MNERPLVMCLTNSVAANLTANCLLSVGARPAMVENPREAGELAKVADALLVNLGTVDDRQAEAMREAARVACERGTPWVLDPVGVQLLAYRRSLVEELISQKPSLIRGNHHEIEFLMGTVPSILGTVPMLSTGAIDRIFPQGSVPLIEVTGGVPMLQTVTATGCSQGGICAAFLGRGLSPQDAAVRVSRLMKRAGELAWERAKAPGSFQVALVDALWELSHD